VSINFEKPNKADIVSRISAICESEQFKISDEELSSLVEFNYPDIRAMVMQIQSSKISNKSISNEYNNYDKFKDAIEKGNVDYIFSETYSSDFDALAFNKWFFNELFRNHQLYSVDKLCNISVLLADTEKSFNQGCNTEVVFLSNILQIMKEFKK
jgi:DNA polymerase III delta prime subunit